MKRISCCFALLICLLLFTISVSAAESGYTVGISAPDSLKQGEAFEVELVVKTVPASGMLSADFVLHFDDDYVTFTEAAMTESPNKNWVMYHQKNADCVNFMIVDNMVSTPAKAEEIRLAVRFQVKTEKTVNMDFTMTDLNGSDGTAAYIEGSFQKKSVLFNAAQRLKAPTLTWTADDANAAIAYTITDSNPAEAVAGYTLTVFDGETAVCTVNLEKGKTKGIISAQVGVIPAGKSYRAVASVRGAEGYADSETASAKAVLMPDKPVSLTVFEQPLLGYTEGVKLDLSKLRVLLTYCSGARVIYPSEDVKLTSYETSMADGSVLSSADNGKKITVTVVAGNVKLTCETAKLTVNTTPCNHSNTREETVAATCNQDGYTTVYCADCGAVMGGHAITERPDHTYGELKLTASDEQSGVEEYQAICSVCGQVKTEIKQNKPVPEDTDPIVDADETTASQEGETKAQDSQDAQDTQAEEKKGCGSVLGTSSVIMSLVFAGAAAFVATKKQKEI